MRELKSLEEAYTLRCLIPYVGIKQRTLLSRSDKFKIKSRLQLQAGFPSEVWLLGPGSSLFRTLQRLILKAAILLPFPSLQLQVRDDGLKYQPSPTPAPGNRVLSKT